MYSDAESRAPTALHQARSGHSRSGSKLFTSPEPAGCFDSGVPPTVVLLGHVEHQRNQGVLALQEKDDGSWSPHAKEEETQAASRH